MVRLVLFDIDGTLVHTGGAGTAAFKQTFATEFNLHHGTEQMKFAGRTDVSLVREFFRLHGLDESPAHFRKFFDRYVFWLDQILVHSQGEPCRGVGPWLAELQALPHPPRLGLLTGNIRLGAEIKLRYFNLWEFFETGAFADDHEDRNQIAAVARERGGRLLGEHLRGDQIVVVGDTPLDIECGRAIGARVLAVGTGNFPIERLRAHHPDWAVPNLDSIRAAQLCQC